MTDRGSRESIEACARAVGLELPTDTVIGVVANFELLAQMAQMLDGVPLDDSADEPATTFVPR